MGRVSSLPFLIMAVKTPKYRKVSKIKPSPYSYRKLISEKDFLQVQRRARGIGVGLVSIDFEGMELRFKTKSQSRRGVYYTQIIQFENLEPDQFVVGKNLAEILRSAKMKIYSNCPSFQYWYAYKAWKMGYGLYPETRFPHIRNPRLVGYASKDLYAVLQTFPFLSASIGRKMKNYWTSEQAKQIEKGIEKTSKDVNINELLGGND